MMVLLVGRIQSVMQETKYYLTLLLLFKLNGLVLVYSLAQQRQSLKHVFEAIFYDEFLLYVGLLLLLTVIPLILIQIAQRRSLCR